MKDHRKATGLFEAKRMVEGKRMRLPIDENNGWAQEGFTPCRGPLLYQRCPQRHRTCELLSNDRIER